MCNFVFVRGIFFTKTAWKNMKHQSPNFYATGNQDSQLEVTNKKNRETVVTKYKLSAKYRVLESVKK